MRHNVLRIMSFLHTFSTTERSPMISTSKKILFSLTPAFIVLVALALAETGLRLFNESLAVPLATPVTYDGIEWLQINRGYLEKYFPANVVLLPEFKPSLMKRHKDPAIFRVLCLGGSSMFGTPYQMTATIPSIVRKQLRQMMPDREIEVINLGASAINTNVIADLSSELVPFQPDLVLLYAGHNEFYGPDGVGASFVEKHLPFLTPLKYTLRDLRIVRLLQRGLAKVLKRKTPDEQRNMMKLVSEGTLVQIDSPDAERIFSIFEKNLVAIVGIFQKARIPIIISDVTSNLLFPPFAYDFRPGLKEVEAEFRQGRYRQALNRLQSSFNIDSTNAGINYWYGRGCYQLNKPDSSAVFLRRARDFDLLKFRAPDRTDRIISEVCRRLDVPFVSADSAFASVSPLGIAGENLFWEHLHPNARGYYLIADLFLKKMADLNLLPVRDPKGSFSRRLPLDRDSLDFCWLDLAYADLSMQHLTSQWPFENCKVNATVIDSADDELRQTAMDVYTRKISWDEGCYRTALRLRGIGRYGDAITTYNAMIDDYRYNSYAYYLLANLYKERGDLDAATRSYVRSIEIKPDYPYSQLELGLLEINKGHFDEAINKLTAAARLTEGKNMPGVQASIYYGLSAAFANKGDFPKAIAYVDESLKLAPSYEPAQQLKRGLEAH
jgi:tetratricopeptide (TPR) repeat protein